MFRIELLAGMLALVGSVFGLRNSATCSGQHSPSTLVQLHASLTDSSLVSTGTAQRESQDEFSTYVNPFYGWSVSYPRGWTVEPQSLHSVVFRHATFVLGIHVTNVVKGESLEKAADRVLEGLSQHFSKPYETTSRQKITLPNGMQAIEVVHRLGALGGGKSRKLICLAHEHVFLIDAETRFESWETAAPDFDHIIKSFKVQTPKRIALRVSRSPQPGQRVVISQERVLVKVGEQILASCKMGEVLRVHSVKGNWLGVQKNGKAGWINKKNVVVYEYAKPIFDRLVRESKDRKSAHLTRADFFLDSGQLQMAIDDYSQALRIGGDDAEILNSRGLTWFRMGDTDKALEDYRRAIELAPRNHHVYVNRAGLWLALGNHPEAIRESEKAIEIAPDFSGGYHVRGAVLLKMGQIDLAMKDLNHAIRLNPEMVSHYNNRGSAWLAKGDYARAFKDFNKALQLDADDVKVLLNRGEAWLALGDFSNAVRDFSDVLRIQPDNAYGYLNRGIVRYTQGRLRLALTDLNRSIALRSQLPVPDLVGAYINRGLAHLALSSVQEAVEDFTSAIQLDPHEAMAFLYRGEIWLRLAQANDTTSEEYLTKSLDDFNEALRLDATLELAYLNRFLTRILRDEFALALEDIESAIALNPLLTKEILPGIIGAGEILKTRHQYHEALELYDTFIRLDPECMEAYLARAVLLVNDEDESIRDLERARTDARRACELTGSTDHQVLRVLASVFAMTGDFESAIKWQKKTIELAPQQFKQDDEEMLKRLEQQRKIPQSSPRGRKGDKSGPLLPSLRS